MAFWSSQTLERRLGDIVKTTTKEQVDCNAVTLRIGPEIYITPSLEEAAPNNHTKQLLGPGQPFAIPPGQFAFLLTEESVVVPATAMAFISMKATFKLKGLVNVSGFHVDPGWSGPLIFAVFNAGPSAVHLQRGLPLFLIWFADLDHASDKRKTKPGPTSIPPQMINNITGELDSLYALDRRVRDEHKRLDDGDKALSDRIHEVEKGQRSIGTELLVLRTLAVGLVIAVIVSFFRSASPTVLLQPPAPIVAPTQGTLTLPTPTAPEPNLPPAPASQGIPAQAPAKPPSTPP